MVGVTGRGGGAHGSPSSHSLQDGCGGDCGCSANGGGYGQGKFVAERVLAASGVEFSSVRVGQVSGGKPRGAWATTDWFPILVKTSLALGALPSDEQARSTLYS